MRRSRGVQRSFERSDVTLVRTAVSLLTCNALASVHLREDADFRAAQGLASAYAHEINVSNFVPQCAQNGALSNTAADLSMTFEGSIKARRAPLPQGVR